MANSRVLRPQFFHTLVPGFQTHLMIPEHFFSKYIEEGTSATAELKSDAPDRAWRVKMTGRKLGDGWREFAVDDNLRLGGVLLVRYEGDMVFHVSNLGQNCCEVQDISPTRDKTLLKKRMYPRCDEDDDIELPRNKKVKLKSPEAEPLSSSSSSDNACFVALVTASSLRTDKMYLPQHVTSSNGLTRKCRKIVLVDDGGGKSWTLDLSFNKSSDTFYMSRGWRNFCEENDQEPGGFFMFKLVGNGETPVLSLGSANDTRCCSQASESESLSTEVSSKDEYVQGESSEDDCSSMELLTETGKKKRGRDSAPSSLKQFVTLTITPSSVRQCRLGLLKSFTRDNDINKPGMITLLGRDGTRHQTRLVFDKVKRIMALEGGWKDFAEANGLKTGDSFTLKLIWEDKTPVLNLCPEECSFGKGQGGCSETNQRKSPTIERAESSSLKAYVSTEPRSNSDSSSAIQNRSVTLTLTPEEVRACKLHLPKEFMKTNGINRLGKITLLGENKREWSAYLLTRDGTVALGIGWDKFCEANGVSLGESFTLEFSKEQNKTTPVLKFCSLETNKKVGKS